MSVLLRCAGLTKAFGAVSALRGVDFDLRSGEVHALAGENGAGKSTLMHLLAGVYQPDYGTMEFEGTAARPIADEREAQRLGVAMVYQERSLFDRLSVAENLFVNRQPGNRLGVIDRKKLVASARVLLEKVDLRIDPRLPLDRLTPAQQQMVEIAKALSFHSRIFILDEPTAALTVTETDTLFRIIRHLKQEGLGIVYISHRLHELFEIADRVSVLKDGVMQGTWNMSGVTTDFLVSKMVGRESLEVPHKSEGGAGPAQARLKVRDLRDEKLKGISFIANAGEIIGLAGLAGAGRTETALAIFGVRQANGEVLVDGRSIEMHSTAVAMKAGIGYLPEDRKDLGLFLSMSIWENIVAAKLESFGGWLMDQRKMEDSARQLMDKLRIVAPGPGTISGRLSGGNQQKVLLARWLLRDPGILIVDEPTRGVDVKAKAEIHRILRAVADRGAAVVVISSELQEILAVSDRILVMREGRITAELDRSQASEESILRYAAMPAEETAA